MALKPCGECAKPVSTEAMACPHCAAPLPVKPPGASPAVQGPTQYSTKQAIALIGFSTLVLFGYIAHGHYKEQSKAKSREEDRGQQVCTMGDLECLGNRALASASVYCRSHIERKAVHSVKWIDGILTPKFSHFRWRNPIEGSITFIGNRAEFQNGFGAFTPVVYECDLAADEKTVLEVRVIEGHLP